MTILWYNEKEKIHLMIVGFSEQEDLLRTADSVIMCKMTEE